MRCKNRVKYTPKKNNHTQDSIYVVRQFTYVHGVARISLFLGKNIDCDSTIFLSQKRRQNPNFQNNSFYNLRTGFTMDYKMSQNFFLRGVAPKPLGGLSISTMTCTYRPKPPFHGLSLKKSPIKNHAILFKSGCQPDQTKLGSTKLNT